MSLNSVLIPRWSMINFKDRVDYDLLWEQLVYDRATGFRIRPRKGKRCLKHLENATDAA